MTAHNPVEEGKSPCHSQLYRIVCIHGSEGKKIVYKIFFICLKAFLGRICEL